MQAPILTAVTYSLLLIILGTVSVDAQAPSPVRTEARSPLSEIARDISNWFIRATGTDDSRHREGPLPARLATPLPRPRPSDLTSVSVAPITGLSKPRAAPVPSNNESSQLTTSSVSTSKAPSELTTSPVQPNKESSEFTAEPVAPKKEAPAPVLIND
jgi:hypothetical protein